MTPALHLRRPGPGMLSLCGLVGAQHTEVPTRTTCSTCRILADPPAPPPARANGHSVACMCPKCHLERLRATG